MKKSGKRSKRNLLSTGSKANVDSKLTQAALILEYAFEYNVNFKQRVITISRDIDQKEFDRVDGALTELESQSRKSVTIRINSPGGEVYQALAIIGRLKKSSCRIITEGYGHVMSAATLILAAGNIRKMSKYGFFMHHEASNTLTGKLSELEAEVKQMKIEDLQWAEWMSELTHESKDFWSRHGVGTNAYFKPEELLSMGVIDEII